jgi:hypothetical protein
LSANETDAVASGEERAPRGDRTVPGEVDLHVPEDARTQATNG